MSVGYTMALPYLLTLYQLHLQFARSVDMRACHRPCTCLEAPLEGVEVRRRSIRAD